MLFLFRFKAIRLDKAGKKINASSWYLQHAESPTHFLTGSVQQRLHTIITYVFFWRIGIPQIALDSEAVVGNKVRRVRSVVSSVPCVRRVAGSNPTLAATSKPFYAMSSPSLTDVCSSSAC